MTGRQNLNYLASVLENVTEDKINELIKFSKLGDKIDEKVKKYSLGMKQRLGLAQALMGDISLLILDEPTNGLDPIGVVELKNVINTLVKEKGVSIFISSHILSEIENICTKVIFIDDGEIISIQEIDNKSESINVKNMFIKTNFTEKASEIIQNIDHVKLLKVKNDGISILINIDLGDVFKILKELKDAGINVEGFFEIKETLEDRFIKMMGGITIMNKYIWQELKRVLIKKKIPIIIMLIFIPVFGLLNTMNTQTYEKQLNQYNSKLKNLKKYAATI